MRILLGWLILILLIPNHSVIAQENSKIVFLGASNTATTLHVNGSYVTKLPEFGEPWSNIEITNSGVNGAGFYSYYYNEEALWSKTLAYCPNYIFIMLGGNDYLRQTSALKFENYLNWTLSYLKGHYNGNIIIANIIWSPLEHIFGDDEITRFYSYQEVITNASNTYDIQLFDAFSVTENHDNYFYADYIHLNDTGQYAMAKAINTNLTATINQYTASVPACTNPPSTDSSNTKNTTSKSKLEYNGSIFLAVSILVIISRFGIKQTI